MTMEVSYSDQLVGHQDLFLTTKLQITSTMRAVISRPRLLERIDQGLEKKLTLICAPAGSGKTTLFTNWLQSRGDLEVPTAWLSLDEGDNDPARFWRYVCTALTRIYKGSDEQIALLRQTFSDSGEAMLIRLMNLLADSSMPFVLALDDYHLITSEPIQRGLSFLLEHMPATMHLVLLTRFEPSLPLARLRVRGQITEIREADLQFTLDEVRQFFVDSMGLSCSPEHIEVLARRTEGWIAGLQLAALAMRDCSNLDVFVRSFTGSSRYIIDYLLEEVINHQPEAVQAFLLSTSVLDRVCASLCASVLSKQDELEEQSPLPLSQSVDTNRYCQEMLEHLERMNLFLIPLDQERHWYRYHPLFAEALLARFSQLHPSLSAVVHVRASIWYEQQELIAEAIEHALAARDVPRACRLIEQLASTSLVSQLDLMRWVQLLPEEEIRSHPCLCFLYAWVLILHGSDQWATRKDWIEEGMRGLAQDRLLSDQMIGEVLAVRATIASLHGEIETALPLAQQAMRLLPATHWQQSMLLLTQGATFSLAGNIEKAGPALTRAIAAFQEKSPLLYFFSIAILAEVRARQGYLNEAIQLFQRVIVEGASQPGSSIALAYGGLGNALFERNELDAARSILQQGVEQCAKAGRSIRSVASIYVPLACVQYAQGDMNAALATLSLLELQAQQDGSKRVQALVAARRAYLHLRRGDVSAAAHWAEERELHFDTALQTSSQADSREFEYVMLARILMVQGRYDQARNLLQGLCHAAYCAQRYGSVIEIQILQALNEQAQGALVDALAILEHVLEQTCQEGYIRLFVDEGEPMRALLSRMQVKEERMQLYVKSIIEAFHSSGTHVGRLSEASQVRSQELLDPLSERELEVLHVLEIGDSNATIAKKLVIAPATVKRHMSNIFSKLGVENRTQAVARARDLKIL